MNEENIKKVEVKIAGMSYILKTDEDEEYIYKIASFLNKRMSEVMASEPKLSTALMAMLTAFLITDEYFKHLSQCEKIKNEITVSNQSYIKAVQDYEIKINEYKEKLKEYETRHEENQQLQQLYEEQKIELERLQRMLQEMQAENEKYKKEVEIKNKEIIKLKKELDQTRRDLDEFINTFDIDR